MPWQDYRGCCRGCGVALEAERTHVVREHARVEAAPEVECTKAASRCAADAVAAEAAARKRQIEWEEHT